MSGINLLKCCCTGPCDIPLVMSFIKANWKGYTGTVAQGDFFEVVSDFPTGCFPFRDIDGVSMNFDGFSLSYDLASMIADRESISAAEARTRLARCWENGRFFVDITRACLYDLHYTCYPPDRDIPCIEGTGCGGYGDLVQRLWSSGDFWSSGTPAYVWTYDYETGIFEVEGAPITVTIEPGWYTYDSSVYYQPKVRLRIIPEV
jgi:hypothetical protein